MSKKDDPIHKLLFAREFKALKQAEKITHIRDVTIEEVQQKYKELANQYKKLLKNTVKLTNLSDTNQKKLREAKQIIEKQNNKLKSMNQEIKLKNEELTDAYHKIEFVAKTDSLTKLWNRRAIMEKLNHEKNRFHRDNLSFSIILCDVDYFKKVNDTYGHDFGDYLLSSLAEFFTQNKRPFDEVARWGGEEFIFLLPATEEEEAKVVAEDLREKIAKQEFTFENQSISITVSLGISMFKNRIRLEDCIKSADVSLYEAKRRGRNQTIAYDIDLEEV
ncbi:MAG: GGDEF domain-containing protein [Spirochaetota bacterium]